MIATSHLPGHLHGHHVRSRRLPVSWATVGLLAVLVAYADGFWLTSLRGAVGAISHAQAPVRTWVRVSALMTPVFLAGIVVALWLTNRWFAGRRRVARAVFAGALLLTVTTGIAVGQATVMAVQDYAVQSDQLATLHSSHLATTPAAVAVDPGACTSLCAARQLTVHAHVKGVTLATGVILLTNLVLLAWVLAARGGRLWLPTEPDENRSEQPQPEAVGALA